MTSPEVEQFFTTSKHPLVSVARHVHALILNAAPDLTSGIKWNAPSYHCGEWFATFHLRRPNAVQIVLHRGVAVRPPPPSRYVADPDGLLVWKSLDRATATFTAKTDLAAIGPAFSAVVGAWVERLRTELAAI